MRVSVSIASRPTSACGGRCSSAASSRTKRGVERTASMPPGLLVSECTHCSAVTSASMASGKPSLGRRRRGATPQSNHTRGRGGKKTRSTRGDAGRVRGELERGTAALPGPTHTPGKCTFKARVAIHPGQRTPGPTWAQAWAWRSHFTDTGRPCTPCMTDHDPRTGRQAGEARACCRVGAHLAGCACSRRTSRSSSTPSSRTNMSVQTLEQ